MWCGWSGHFVAFKDHCGTDKAARSPISSSRDAGWAEKLDVWSTHC